MLCCSMTFSFSLMWMQCVILFSRCHYRKHFQYKWFICLEHFSFSITTLTCTILCSCICIKTLTALFLPHKYWHQWHLYWSRVRGWLADWLVVEEVDGCQEDWQEKGRYHRRTLGGDKHNRTLDEHKDTSRS